VGQRLGLTDVTVLRDLRALGVSTRPPGRRSVRHLRVVPDASRTAQRVLDVPPGEVAIAYSADRGWHMVQAPPGWLLELLAELD
jgi:hypothetical protein